MKALNNYRVRDIEKKLEKARFRPLDVMVTGVTGAGKSTTLNTIFRKNVATVGNGVDPETMYLDYYSLNDVFRLWDTPGLGDGVTNDETHKRKLVDLLYKTYSLDGNIYGWIDSIIVVLEGLNRDMGSTYTLLNEVIVPNIQAERILVVINQADVAMKGKYWNVQENKPEEKLQEFLEDKVKSVKRRIKEATGIEIEPIYYSAGEKEEGYMQQKPYNLAKLLYYILKCTPKEKRLVYAENMNREKVIWKDNDDLQDYRKGILGKFLESVTKGMAIGGAIGEALGSLVGLGQVGRIIGAVGGVVVGVEANIIGGFVDFFSGIF